MSSPISKVGLSFKLGSSIFLSISIIFIVIFIYNYNVILSIVERNIETNAENLAQNKINQVEKVLISVEQIPKNTAKLIEQIPFSEEELMKILFAMVESNPDIYGATIAFEPYKFDKSKKYFAPYVYKSFGTLKSTTLGTETYNYHNSDWYRRPKNLGRAIWSEPYYDDGGGNVMMSTFSVPIYKSINGEKRIIGVITADVSLNWLDQLVSTIKVLKSGYGIIISKEGKLVTESAIDGTNPETIYELAKEKNSPQMERAANKMLKGQTGFEKISQMDRADGKNYWIYYAPIPHNGWSLAVIYPLGELTIELDTLNSRILGIGVLGIIILFIVIMIISKSITKPLRELALATDHIAQDKMDISLPEVKSRDEIGHLTKSFILMRDELKKKMTELRQANEGLVETKTKLEDYNKSLEDIVNQRTKEILIEAKELSVLKSRFISMISHELRTPLFTILSSAEILELYSNRINDSEKKEQFNVIHTAIEEILELLNDVISINKSELGKIDLIIEKFNIVEFSKKIIDELSGRWGTEPKLIFTSSNEEIILNSDKKELRKIISNLVINSLKYTPIKKNVYFHLSLNQDQLVIEVKDEGIGIKEEDQERIFDVFVRGKNVGNINGTGLGLSIIKRSIEILGGEIFFSSKEGVGSEFIVKIPINSLEEKNT